MYITVIFSILLSQLVKIQKFVLGLIWLLVCCFSLELKNLLGLSSWNFLNFCGTRCNWVSPLHFDNQTFHFLVRTWISSQTGIFWQGFNWTRYTTSPGVEPQHSHYTSLFSCSSTSPIYTGQPVGGQSLAFVLLMRSHTPLVEKFSHKGLASIVLSTDMDQLNKL